MFGFEKNDVPATLEYELTCKGIRVYISNNNPHVIPHQVIRWDTPPVTNWF